jgi:hypothetical protein
VGGVPLGRLDLPCSIVAILKADIGYHRNFSVPKMPHFFAKCFWFTLGTFMLVRFTKLDLAIKYWFCCECCSIIPAREDLERLMIVQSFLRRRVIPE